MKIDCTEGPAFGAIFSLGRMEKVWYSILSEKTKERRNTR